MKSLARAFGAGVLAAALAVAAATALAATDDPAGASGLMFFAVAFGVLVAISVVMGVFGREFALIAVGLCGVWVTLTTVLIVRFVVDDTTELLAGFVFVLGLFVAGFFVAWLGWFIGTVVCVSKGHFTSRDLSEIAYARSGRSSPDGSVYDDALEELVSRLAVGERVTARSMAIEHRSTWHRPLAVVATDRRLVMAPMDTEGELGDDTVSIPAHALATAKVPSLNRDGTTRRALSSHNDVIDITTTDGSRSRFVLAYESKVRAAPNAAPDPVGGADAIRHWIRTHATTYH
ncbi:MAG TPA: hypothetical protein VLN74_01565 [Ilumatobacteraceae bacterium]|nr:hypothetical protein [Ilumatobacteraceae bacterium]